MTKSLIIGVQKLTEIVLCFVVVVVKLTLTFLNYSGHKSCQISVPVI